MTPDRAGGNGASSSSAGPSVPSPLHVELPDGLRLQVRRVDARDGERLVAGFARLSQKSRVQRFQHVVDELDEEQVRLFTDVDQTDHLAWVALDRDDPDHPGAGVVRAIRMQDDPTAAEIALTVADDLHGRGVGTLLLAVIAVDAGAHDVEVLRSWVLEDNRVMLDILHQLGARIEHDAFDVAQVDQPVVTDPDELPDTTVGRVTRQLLQHLVDRPDGPLRIGDHGDAPPAPPRRSRQERGGLRDWLDAEMPDSP